MSRTLVTGATGFIGWRLAERWHAAGRDVIATGLAVDKIERKRANGLRQAGVPLILGDLTERSFREAVLDGVDTVIHLAAAQHQANVGKRFFFNINVGVTRDLLKESIERGVKRFFFASSIGVYGVNARPGIDEDTPLAPDNAYGRSKLEAERVIAGFSDRIQLFVGRIGETYGPGDMRLCKLYSAIMKKRFLLVGSGDNLHQPIYVDDLIEAIDRLISNPQAVSSPIILCGDRAVTTREMCESIAGSLGASLGRFAVPMFPLLIAAVGMELTLGKVGIQPPLHRRRLDFFRKSLSFSTARRERLLSLPPQRSFEQGARETAAWYRDNGWL
jgi:nucleoside-diphosphate-sugar epimerase